MNYDAKSLQYTVSAVLSDEYIYQVYHDFSGYLGHAIDVGYVIVAGGAIKTNRDDSKTISGFFTVSKLGKTFLEWQEL